MLDLLAFDYGASSGRAIVGKYNGKHLKLKEVHRFSNDPVYLGGSLYWDFLRLYFEMLQGIKKASSEGNLASIGIDTWGVDFGLLDANGKLLSNPLHYRDSSTEGVMEEAFGIVPKGEIYKRTGIQFLEFNTLYQLMAMKKNNNSAYEKATALLFIPDLFKYFLTGEKSTEFTVASTSQMLNIESSLWDNELLQSLGVRTDILTDIILPGTIGGKILPEIASRLGIPALPVVAVAGHDTASAVASIPDITGHAYLSSGTWSLLGVESDNPIVNDAAYIRNLTNEGGFGHTVRLLKNIMGLWIYQECRREWIAAGDDISFDELEDAALSCTPFLSFIDPDDYEFYRPGSMPDKIRAYLTGTDQPVPDSKPGMVRCILESLALKYRMVLEELEQITECQLPVLHIVGGGCKNRLLSQYTANSTGRTVVTGPTEATATGNIIVQMLAIGEIKNLSEGRTIVKESFPSLVYEPENAGLWDAAYERFKKLVNDRRLKHE